MNSWAHIRLQLWKRPLLLVSAFCFASFPGILPLIAQAPDQSAIAKRMEDLSASIAKAQSQIDESQRQLQLMREQLDALQRQLAIVPSGSEPVTSAPSATIAAQQQDLKEQQDLQASQIATLAQEKVESDSKYPLKLSGLLLFTGFSNSTRMDMAATPTSALFGSGSAGATVRQTILGVDARGPHLLGAESRADLRVDFDGEPSSGGTSSDSYPGSYNANATLLRLRTAHAALDWSHTSLFFSLDRPILSPDTPASLTAVAEPALAWSGNLWSWNPQIGIEHYISGGSRGGLFLQAALIDVSDAPQTLAYRNKNALTPFASGAEQRMRPGGELRLAWTGKQHNNGPHLGFGGYIGPHTSTSGIHFNAWATTADLDLTLGPHLEFSGNGYRGQALGGLGGGAYKDYVAGTRSNGEIYFRSLDAVGGWAQLKQEVSERLQFNEAFGIDQVFAKELRAVAGASTQGYLNFARNRTWTANTIYSPTAYLLFSFEYRRVETAPVAGRLWTSNVFGVAAGYRF